METHLELARAFIESYPDEAALSMEQMAAEDVTALLSEIPVDIAARAIVRMASHQAVECLRSLPLPVAGAVLGVMPRDHGALVLRRMRPEDRAGLLKAAPATAAPGIAVLLRFPENSAGALMDPEVLALPKDVGVGEAFERVRRSEGRIFYYVYIVDRERKLVGVANLRELIEADENKLLEDIMRAPVARLPVHADFITMRAHPAWREYHALPVVDDHGVLVGVLRYKTLRAEAGEDSRIAPGSDSLDTSLALGELYWSTLGQLLQTMWPAASSGTANSEESDGR
jgi:magnesium transporter